MWRRILLLSIVIAILVSPARADRRWIIRSTRGINAVQAICSVVSCSVIRDLGDPLSQTFLIITATNLNLRNLDSLPLLLLSSIDNLGIVDIEPDLSINLLAPLTNTLAGVPSGLYDRTPVAFYGNTVGDGYANQPAAEVVRAPDARSTFGVSGTGIVAFIDTGVDPNHPALQGVLVPGYDFTRDQYGMAPETADLSDSTAAVVDGGGEPIPVNSSTVAVLNDSTAAVVDGYGAFGHGTMVAGIVHLVAPQASLMPLKAFGANGYGYLSDILRAVYWAVQNGARVINMSFSMHAYSAAFKRAVDYAASQNLISVAAAGNDGRETVVYPAGFRNDVMGIASTNLMDQRSRFSNYGSELVWVAAPGEYIISTYPFSTYAAGSGTSFSTPFVAGTAALLLSARWSLNQFGASAAIANARPVGQDLGNGRLDVYRAMASLASR